ncbi:MULTISPECIES: YoaK family protein [unclassified Sinorhizobium]|uniref:YoaK family protein n=1 Tax=unclassified Sinorhizobium TaxID=2613772 RepID=UPI0035232A31
MRPALPIILSFTGGYVDTAGFLALGGLFAAHVTGNFVTLGAALTYGTSGIIAKLLALPVFCVSIIVLRYLVDRIGASDSVSLRAMLIAKSAFLIAGAVSAIYFAPFAHPDSAPLVLTGMLLVIAMAIQNAAHRIHLGSAPPSTLMTGTTTQIMIDIGDILSGVPAESKAVLHGRLTRMALAVAGFAAGCGAAALLFILFKMWCFVLPPLLGISSALLVVSEPKT